MVVGRARGRGPSPPPLAYRGGRPESPFYQGAQAYETYGVKQAQEWLGHSDPATTLRHYVRLMTAARAKTVAGLDEVTRAALERAEEQALVDAQPLSRSSTTSSRAPAGASRRVSRALLCLQPAGGRSLTAFAARCSD